MRWQKKRPGDRFEFPADLYNTLIDMAESWVHKNVQPATPTRVSATIIKVRNETGQDVPRFGVIGLYQSVFDPAQNLPNFQNTPVLRGVLPLPGKAFGIADEPIAQGAIGSVVVAGCVICQVSVFDPDPDEAVYAEPTQNNVVALRTYPGGTLRLIWREPGDTGDKWAVGVFQSNAHPLVRVRLANDLTKDSGALIDAQILTRGPDGVYVPGSRPTIKVGDLSGLGFYASAMTKATVELHFGLTINDNFHDVVVILTAVRCR